ncbi:MAG: hypothetical protein ACXWVJ_07790, partial [Caulobacteraceae bacterium]
AGGAMQVAWRAVAARQAAIFPGRSTLYLPTRLSLDTHGVRPEHPELGWNPEKCRVTPPPGRWRRIWDRICRRRSRGVLSIAVDADGLRLTLDGYPPTPKQ